MERNIVSRLIVTLLLTSMLTLAFNFQPVKADWTWNETIYIRADGSVEPDAAPISSSDHVNYVLTDNIIGNVPIGSSAIVVEKSNIVIDGKGYTLQSGEYGTGLRLDGVESITIKNVRIMDFDYGILLDRSSHNDINGNHLVSNHLGIDIYGLSNYNYIASNNFEDNGLGLHFEGAFYNNLIGNEITRNSLGIWLLCSENNIIRENNINANDYYGVYSQDSCNNVISENNIRGNSETGILLSSFSDDNTFSKNVITGSIIGVDITDYSSGNDVFQNTIAENELYGIRIDHIESSNNKFYHNILTENPKHAHIQTSGVINTWDDGYPSGGNYWEDYRERYPYAEEIDNSGIWDTPYVIAENNQDNYPLVGGSPPPPPPPSDFEISVSPEHLVASPRFPSSFIVTVRSVNGFSSPVHLSVLNLGPELTAELSSDIVTPPSGGSVWTELTISVLSSYITTYTIIIEGTGDGITHMETASLEVPFMSVPYYNQGDAQWCGPASIAMVMRFYGISVHPWDVSARLGLTHDQMLNLVQHKMAIQAYLSENNLSWEWNFYPITLETLKNMLQKGEPVILFFRFQVPGSILMAGHNLVITGYYNNGVEDIFLINDPGNVVHLLFGLGEELGPNVQVEVGWSNLEPYATRLLSWALGIQGTPRPVSGNLNLIGGKPEQAGSSFSFSHGQVAPWLNSVYIWEQGWWQGITWKTTSHSSRLDPEDYIDVNVNPYKWVVNPTDKSRDYGFEIVFSKPGFNPPPITLDVSNVPACSGSNPYYQTRQMRDILGKHYGQYTITLNLLAADGSLLDHIDLPPIKYSPAFKASVHSPANLFVTDPLGRSTGFDPVTQEIVEEIPEAVYSGPASEPQTIMIPDPLDGAYLIQVIGIDSGTYVLNIELSTFEETVTETYTGSIEEEQIQTHRVFIPESGDTVILDDTPPTTLLTIGEPRYEILTQTYVSKDSPFTLQANDDTGSGVASTTYRIYNATYDSDWVTYVGPLYLAGLSDGIYSVDCNSTDNAGNVELTNTVVVILDNTPPTTVLTIGEPKYVTGETFVSSETSFTLEANDNTGSDVALISYRVYNDTYNSGWLFYTGPLQLTGLTDGVYVIEFTSTDNVGNIELSHTATIILDNTGPSVIVVNPPAGWALQGGVNFVASAVDAGSGVVSLNFSIREANGGDGIPVGFEDLPATYDVVTGKWTLFFDTLQLPDGYYVVLVNAEDHLGHIGSTIVPYSIRNWAVLELLPATESNKAGRTMPVKFSLRVAEAVDPAQPFVWNEELTIVIYEEDNPEDILQTSTYGDTAQDYRIDSENEHYVTNFQTIKKKPTTYVVEIYRNGLLIGSFEFSTVK